MPTNTLFLPHNTFRHLISIQPVTTTDICDQILISLNFSLYRILNCVEFGAKQWHEVVGVHKLSDKKIALTFLGWGGFSHQVCGDGKKFNKNFHSSFSTIEYKTIKYGLSKNNLAPSLKRAGFAFRQKV